MKRYETIDGKEYINENFEGRALSASRWLLAYRLLALATLGVAVINPAVLPAAIGCALLVALVGQKQYYDSMYLINEDKEIVAIDQQENTSGDGI